MAENPELVREPTPAPGWPEQAADEIVKRVGQVRDKTTGPALTAARGVVYGLAILFLATVVAILSAIMFVRILDIVLENAIGGNDHTWLAHLVVGLPFLIGGLFAWRKRVAPTER